ncbi:efflux RND transporter periplasmic adaptor subunit [Rufibacter psychrotolerans]|uniref:efflux RND transporter periplasmic adaptor subunit n=1 Tax=Rufibacter psychrotolerans TaxID=2812556 RepID=UPI001967DA01|nr:efflux RND transporter periplasmic adaptor subunit [Rufibacter sp. SYSU D00308]
MTIPFRYFPLLSFITLSAGLAGCEASSTPVEKKAAATTLPVTQLITKDTTLHLDYVSDIQAVRHVEIRAKVGGFLEQILVDEGQEVKKGQPLFRINAQEYQSELAKAKASLNSALAETMTAEVEVKRVQSLVDKKVISATELQVAKAKLKAAQAKVAEARSAQESAAARVAYTYIKAPFNGIIDRIPLKVGSLIEEGTLLTSVSDLNAVYAYFEVSEKEYLQYAKAQLSGQESSLQQVQLILADGSKYPYPGKIETMEGVFEPNTGSIAFRAKFPNPRKLLKHHSSGKVRLFNEVDSALLLPQKAAFEIQDKNFVYVVDKDNKVKTRSFAPKARISHFYIVESGLEPGEKVVYEGVQTLREGTTIEPELIQMDSLLTASAR